MIVYGRTTLREGKQRRFDIVDRQSGKITLNRIPSYSNSNPGVADLFLDPDGSGGLLVYLDEGKTKITTTIEIGQRRALLVIKVNCEPRTTEYFHIKMGTEIDKPQP